MKAKATAEMKVFSSLVFGSTFSQSGLLTHRSHGRPRTIKSVQVFVLFFFSGRRSLRLMPSDPPGHDSELLFP